MIHKCPNCRRDFELSIDVRALDLSMCSNCLELVFFEDGEVRSMTNEEFSSLSSENRSVLEDAKDKVSSSFKKVWAVILKVSSVDLGAIGSWTVSPEDEAKLAAVDESAVEILVSIGGPLAKEEVISFCESVFGQNKADQIIFWAGQPNVERIRQVLLAGGHPRMMRQALSVHEPERKDYRVLEGEA